MEEKVNFAIVGVFVLGLGAAMIAGVLWLASGGAYRKTYDTYQTYMNESVSGLSRDAPVRYRGVEVGRVRMMALVPTHAEQVQLTLDIAHGTPIKQDTVAMLRVQGLTGIAYVELSGGSASSPILHALPGEPYPVIRSRPSLTLRLESAVTTLLANLNRTSENLNALLNQNNRREFKQTLADLHVVAQTLAARSADINSGLANAARTLNNSARVSAELPQLVERLQKSADEFDRMTSEITRAGQSASAALSGANATLAGTRSDLQQATSDTLPQVRQLVSQLRELTRSLRRVSEEVEQNPSVLLFGKPPPEPGPGE
jgi:phospholipid/cholesterol/gamma-HCH transport system substrate-binding protein